MKDIFLNIKRAMRLVRVINYNPKAENGPLCLDIAVTSRCNHKCIFCGAHSGLKPENTVAEELDRTALENLLEDCVTMGVKEVVFAGDGEPMLYKGLPDIIRRFGDRLDVRLLTNGSTLDLITEDVFSRIGKLTVSMNSISETTHPVVHGYAGASQYPRIKANIERLLKLPDASKKIQINYVICKENAAEFSDVLKLAREWDVYFAIRPVSLGFAELEKSALEMTDLKKIEAEISKANSDSISIRMKATLKQVENACAIGENRLRNSDKLRPCYFGFYWGNIWSNGNYSHCTYSPSCTLGNIKEKRFRDIWKNSLTQSALYAATRMSETNIPVYQSCKGCTGPQLQSASFHRIFSKIPLQMSRLRKNCAKFATSGK